MTTKISGDNISAIANTGVTWNAITVADGSTELQAVKGNGYFLDTNSGIIEVRMPTSPSRGDTVVLVDYSGTFATNKCIVDFGGSNVDSTALRDTELTTNDTIAEFVYVDAAKGWLVKTNTTKGTSPSAVGDDVYTSDEYITATGGTITLSGDYRIHVFTGDNCFVVTGTNPAGPQIVDYLVVAGGGGGGINPGGGGGAGGYREGKQACGSPHTASPLAATSGVPVTLGTYPITVGAGGSGSSSSASVPDRLGSPGSNSVFSTITSTGGGGGASSDEPLGPGPGGQAGLPGGSGGGGGIGAGPVGPIKSQCGGAGNTPPVAPSQGNPGGASSFDNFAYGHTGGGGGAATAGTAASGTPYPSGPYGTAGDGGNGAGTGILFAPIAPTYGTPGPCGSVRYFAGGGSGSARSPNPSTNAVGTAGYGGGATYVCGSGGGTGTANTGGGGGPGYNVESDPAYPSTPLQYGGSGGKGIVIIRYKVFN